MHVSNVTARGPRPELHAAAGWLPHGRLVQLRPTVDLPLSRAPVGYNQQCRPLPAEKPHSIDRAVAAVHGSSAQPHPPQHAMTQMMCARAPLCGVATLALLLLCVLDPTAAANPPEPPPPPAVQEGPDKSVLQRIAGVIAGGGQPAAVKPEAGHPNEYSRHEQEGIRHANYMQNLPDDERYKLELEMLREAAKSIRDRDHAGDTHKYFDALDHTDDDHLAVNF